MKKYKIGLLLDSLYIKTWQYHILDFILANPSFEIELLIINDAPVLSKKKSSHLVYKVFRRLDKKIFKTKSNLFALQDVSHTLKDFSIISVKPLQTRSTDEISPMDLAVIQKHELDIIIRFGFRILKGNILSVAKYGVWSLHHGDNKINRGGPPAFWEVVNKEAVTGVTLLRLSNDLDGGEVLDKSFSKTDLTSFNRNQTMVFWSGIELFCASLARFQKDGPFHFFEGTKKKASIEFYSRPIYRNPLNGQALKIFFNFWFRRIKEATTDFLCDQQWSIYYIINPKKLETSLFRYKKISPPRGIDWADPFIVSTKTSNHIFFEEFIVRNKKGHISVIELDSKGNPISLQPTVALDEKHHLSYPFIFEVEGHLFMVPESASAKKVSLYVCTKFPSEWKKKKDLLSDIEFFDPTLFFHEGMWYLFGTVKPYDGNSPDQYLTIYYTHDLVQGEWSPHLLNPVSRDVRGSRPAGRIVNYNGKIIRPSQIGAPKYGYGVRIHEIVKLSPTEFIEEPVSDILPLWKEGLLATHTFNFTSGLAVTDAQQRRSKI